MRGKSATSMLIINRSTVKIAIFAIYREMSIFIMSVAIAFADGTGNPAIGAMVAGGWKVDSDLHNGLSA